MTKQYTKKQILEAIKHWESVFNGITINITANDKSFDELNDLAASEIQVLREDEISSNLVPIKFSSKFKEKYKKFMTFCDDGTVLLRFS